MAENDVLRVFHLDSARRPGGGQMQITLLLRELAAKRVENTLICPPQSPLASMELPPGVRQIHLPIRGEWDVWSVIRLRRLLRRYDPDILHAHDARAHTICLFARTTRQRLIVHRRVSFPVSRHFLTGWKYGENVDHFVAVCQAAKDQLGKVGVPDSKITVINSAVDERRFNDQKTSRESAREELGLMDNQEIVGTVSRLTREKRHDWLLETLAPMVRNRPSVRIVLIGSGPEESHIQGVANRLRIVDNVIFAGYREDVCRLLPAFDVFVLSSESEGYPISVAEAMAAGCAVVCTDSGGVREIVTSDKTGYLVPVEDSVAFRDRVMSLLDSPAKRRSLGETARQWVREKWGTKVMADSVLDLYTRMVRLRSRES